MRFHVYRVPEGGYIHANGLSELGGTVYYGLKRAGLEVTQGEEYRDNATNIVIGGHLISHLPDSAIIYNSEQVTEDSTWMVGSYKHLLLSHRVWDYSRRNVERLAAIGIKATFVPLGYVPEMTVIKPTDRNIDVLFYGSLNPRRKKILEDISRAGLKVHGAFGIYGHDRDKLIARSKLVLNMHYYDSHVFEIVRVSYLLANHQAVVSEIDHDTDIEDDMRDCVWGVPYDGLVSACVKLCADDELRYELEQRGFNLFTRRKEELILSEAIRPRTLNVGSGRDFRQDYLNIDINPDKSPDVVLDISNTLPQTLRTKRFGEITIKNGMFDTIVAIDVLEHIRDLSTAMTNCLNLLSAGGEMHIYVPYDLSLGAWQDPTHVRAFNEMSWTYYTQWYWYMGWADYRFEMTKCQLDMSVYGNDLYEKGMGMTELARLPRAIEAMRVVLKKRPVNDPELIKHIETKKPKERVEYAVVVAVNDEQEFRTNLLASPGFNGAKIIPVRGASSAAEAFEKGKEQTDARWILFCHQDTYWPLGSGEAIEAEIEKLKDPAIIGFAGMVNESKQGFLIDRGKPFDHLAIGQTTSVDEFAVVLRRNVKLDPDLGWHLWATDAVIRSDFAHIARIPCYHNSRNGGILSQAFHDSVGKLMQKHGLKQIETLCGRFTA